MTKQETLVWTLKEGQECSAGRKNARKHEGKNYTLFSAQRKVGLPIFCGAFLRFGVVSERLLGHEWALALPAVCPR